ncbi:DUF676 domain-containing protein [Penicillium ucsense]|uniref:DUF676 domain-containing protein n=1 Tax=Penicillium ucsense TaxID=2839758 RepID=A0A8J8WJL6_9EURO|nr:DUF676 domain-containing protein [Penicillium ucsense]KAF7739063.1 DUF676 domain-containing protein [Penicillium ucsense]
MSQTVSTRKIQPAGFECLKPVDQTNVDIVAVPIIGAHPRDCWTPRGAQLPWLESELLNQIPRARVLLYSHGQAYERDSIEALGERLLNLLMHERRHECPQRPIFFLCHSTGGLVVKACLALASRHEPTLAIQTSCHGIAFFATPHQGSTYLSTSEYQKSIRQLLRLEQEMPHSLRGQLRPRDERLWHLSNQFKALSADMKVWSFLETVDSTMQVQDLYSNNFIEFHAPITSIRSGLLSIEHETEIPVGTDHAGISCFQDQEKTLEAFLNDLKVSVETAIELSTRFDYSLHVEDEVRVQVNGFFEDVALGVSEESPLRMWTAQVSFKDYLALGPSACLKERLERFRPGTMDDSSLSSFDSRAIPREVFQVHPDTPLDESSIDEKHSESRQDDSEGHRAQDYGTRSFRPSLVHSQSDESSLNPGFHSPTIHITKASTDGSLDIQPAESSLASMVRQGKRAFLARNKRTNPTRQPSGESIQLTSPRPVSASESSSREAEFLEIPSSTRDRINLDADGADLPRSLPRFDRPDPGTEKLLWIHVPYTNAGWVSQVIRRACEDRKEPAFLRKFINDENWYLNLNRARHNEPHARFVRPTCIHSRQKDVSNGASEKDAEDPQLALYLHWDTYRNLIQRRKVVEDRLHQGRSRPVPFRIEKSSLESKLIWQYLGCEPPIHFRRTLDQFGYPNLRSTVARDDDQMLWKRTRKPAQIDEQLRGYLDANSDDPEDEGPSEFMDGNVLMVDQLWLWIVDRKTIITFFPNQEATTSEGKLLEQTNLHSSIYNELNGDLARRFETAGDLAALIMLHATTVLLDRTLHRDLQVLRIFEESISILTESVTKSFKRFRNQGFVKGPADLGRKSQGKHDTAAERDAKDRQTARRNRDDLSVLLELRDIEDELSTILKLLDQQDTVLKSMVKYFDQGGCGMAFLDSAQLRINEYRVQIGEMKENSHLAQKAVETLLDLKQKQANVDEAKMARWQAEETQNQSRSLMVFTIFTVIFLPLSFFTSLFGINAREWSGTPENLSLSEMFEIGAPASFAIIAIALLLAFSERLRQVVTKSSKIGQGAFAEFISGPIKLFLHWESLKKSIPTVRPAEDSNMRKRFDQYLGYDNQRMQFDEDFWQRRQVDRSPLEELERRQRKRAKSMSVANGWGAEFSDKLRRVSAGVSSSV